MKFKDLNIHNKMAYILAITGGVAGLGGAVDMFINTAEYSLNDLENSAAFYDSVMSSEEFEEYANSIMVDLRQDYEEGKVSYEEFCNVVSDLYGSHRISEYIKNSNNEEWKDQNEEILSNEEEFVDRLEKDLFVCAAGLTTMGVGVGASFFGFIADKHKVNEDDHDLTSGR